MTIEEIGLLLFPIGSYYFNETDPTDPATLLGFGNWQSVTDTFMVARGSSYFASGGAATHAHALSDAAYAQAQAFESGGNSFIDSRNVSGDAFTSTHRVNSSGNGATVSHSGGIPLRGATNSASTIPPYQASYVWKRVLDNSFTKYASNPVMTGGATWEGGILCEPTVMLESGTYKMWYRGNSGSNSKIGYATSTDGITWTKSGSNPILTVTGGVAYPFVMKVSSTYYMYAGKISDGNLYRWSSSDGLSWTADNGGAAIIDIPETVCNVSVYYDAGDTPKWRMLFEVLQADGFHLRYAHCADGLAWAADTTVPVYAPPAGNPSQVTKISGVYYCFTGEVVNNHWQISLLKSTDWASWIKIPTKLTHQTWEGTDVTDPCILLDVTGQTHQCYMWYIGNQTDIGMAYLDMSIEDFLA